LQNYLFDRPMLLWLIVAVVVIVALRVWMTRHSRLAGWVTMIGLITLAGSITSAVLIESDSERLRTICREMATAVGDGDVGVLERHIAADYVLTVGADSWDRRELLDTMSKSLPRWDIENERLSSLESVVEDGHATVNLVATCELITDQVAIPTHVSRWRLTFKKIDGQWKVVRIDPKRTQWMPFNNLAEVLRAR
jgi:hypothetical protein